MSPLDARRLRLAGAVLCAALVACAFYGIDRTAAAVGSDLDPREVVRTARVDYFWRIALGGFLGSLAGIGWWWLAGGREDDAFGWLTRATPVVVLGCATLSVLWP